MKKNVSYKNKVKKITLSKKNKKDDFENTEKDEHINNTRKHSSYNEISLILNKNVKNNFKSKNKEKKRINMSKDFIDENKRVLESPIKENKKRRNGIEKNSNKKLKKINNNNRNTNNNRYIPKKKKKILIYNISSGLNSNYNLYANSNNNINYKNNNDNISSLSVSSRANEEKKYDEILELKLINSRLKNEIQILSEKNKSLKEVLDIKNKDIEIIKNKNNKLYNEINDELIILKKKYEGEIAKLKKKNDKSISIIKSLISVIIELCETILINGTYSIPTTIPNNNFNKNKSIKPKTSGLDNNSASELSLDIFESNNTYSTQDIINNYKEEEKKYNLLKQIKEIIIEKINFIKKELNLILDNNFIEKIERIHSWNFQIKQFPTFSFLMSNIKKSNTNNNSIVNNISENGDIFLNSMSKNHVYINDDFDFSVSKSFYNHSQDGSISPKFNNSLFLNNNKLVNNENKISVNIFNESKSLVSSFNEISNNKKENKLEINPKKIINILEYSMVDLNEEENNNFINNKEKNENVNRNNRINNEINKINEENMIIKGETNNFILNSLSFNNEFSPEKKGNNIEEKNDILFDIKDNINNNNTKIINLEDKCDNNLNNFTLKNI